MDEEMSVLSPPAKSTGDQLGECVAAPRSTLTDQPNSEGLITRASRKTLLSKLHGIRGGRITIIDGDQHTTFGDRDSELHAVIRVIDPRFYPAIVMGASIGAGESYRDGYWTCDQLVPLIQIFARNRQASEKLGGFWNGLLNIGRKVSRRINRNSITGSRRNIAAHYDLSNEFYALFLDETMTYSSGVFAESDSSLAEASTEKYDRICRKLQLKPTDHVLEIGTGWGGFAQHAASHYRCQITTTTISQEQHDYARQRFASQGIGDRITLLHSDYRELSGQYDKLVSIEMIEAVGHEYYDTFFAQCSRLLKPQGLLALQAITIPDQRYDSYRSSVDFIQKHIFPGGCLPSLGAMTASVSRVSDMQFIHLEDFAEHYARTLQCWRERFYANADSIRELGMTESFIRLWDYYLCYCEGAFREKQIGVVQLLLQKPSNRQPAHFPSLGKVHASSL
jgi:cyclopropane-fatty-acyl-phospholipid synthase